MTPDEVRAIAQQVVAEARLASLVKMEGHDEVYCLTGARLEHIPDLAAFDIGGLSWDDVQIAPVDHPIWRYPVTYLGIPQKMRA